LYGGHACILHRTRNAFMQEEKPYERRAGRWLSGWMCSRLGDSGWANCPRTMARFDVLHQAKKGDPLTASSSNVTWTGRTGRRRAGAGSGWTAKNRRFGVKLTKRLVEKTDRAAQKARPERPSGERPSGERAWLRDEWTHLSAAKRGHFGCFGVSVVPLQEKN
jgi:hypothetical protein